MNATVKRIVDLLFEDVLMNDETEAIRDEVMNNCQERYAGLIADGYTEDEAIGAVVESLKGMDDVLRDYPRRTMPDDEAAFRKDGNGGMPEGMAAIQWDVIRNLRINVKSADVEVLLTEGRQTIDLEYGDKTWLKARAEGDTLVITQENYSGADSGKTAAFSGTANADGRNGGLFGSGFLSRIFSGIAQFGPDSECRVRLGLPANMLKASRIQTLSGDIRMEVPCDAMDLQSASGDCAVDLGDARCKSLTARSISGDVNVTGSFSAVMLSTTSGDIDFNGSAESLELSTVSGDGNADVIGSRVKASSVSGDLDIDMNCGDSAQAELSSVSGDLDLRLPDHVERVCVKTSTRSGDVEYHNIGLYDDAPVTVKCTSVSGDISVGK